MRFRPRKILICLLVCVSVVVVIANLLGFNDKTIVDEQRQQQQLHPLYDGLLGPRNHASFEERYQKYALNNGTVLLPVPLTNLRVFETRALQILSTALARSKSSDTPAVRTPAFNGSENEWYREQLVWRVWKGSSKDDSRSSPWLAKADRRGVIVDDRILKQMNFVPSRYQNLMRHGSKHSHEELSVELKTIYVPSGVDAETPLGTMKFVNEKCPVSACNLTTDASYEKTADLRLLQADAYFLSFEKKPPGQIWAIWILESPANTVDYNGPENLINWTATYRWDSTIVTPYAKFVPFSSDRRTAIGRRQGIGGRNYAANKTKMVAWFVSNCNAKNRRWEFAQELKKYIPVDIYGACGTMDCPRTEQSQCNDRLNSDYKFYLSFENSNCDHYITEKFFEIGLGNDVVPIVMGARKADYEKAAPPNSFIHVDDFRSVGDLAEYLLKLNASDHLYNEYFRWKGSGEFVNTKFWCRLCALLHDDQRPDMWYTDFHKWWMHDGACRTELWSNSSVVANK